MRFHLIDGIKDTGNFFKTDINQSFVRKILISWNWSGIFILILVEKGEIYSPGKYKRLIKPRSVFCYWAVRELGITATTLAGKLGMTQSGVSRSVFRGKKIVEEMNLKVAE